MGNLGRDAELKETTGGDSVLAFSIGVAVGSRANPETMWVRCSLYGKRADSLAQHLTKGSKVVVSGPLSLSSWTDKEGNARTDLRMRVAELSFAGGRQSEDLGHEVAGHRAAKPVAKPAKVSDGMRFEDDEIPF
jgi:single-strand DNA-binding protein